MKKEIKKGYIKPREISQEMKESYIDYAMSVIVSRALPDVRDGLKPVQRRILYTMYEMGLRHDGKFRKSATVVGGVLGRYHPHGDAPVYQALIRMAQDFSLRYPLIEGQGNIGSIDDPNEFAAMRYTECKLSRIGEELLKDIEKETVEFRPNFDGTRKESVVLPSPLPNLLLNGCMGIAVGMATNIPSHNLAEVCDALIYLIDHPKATTRDLFKFIKGPDFPTGGEVYDLENIISTYSKGKGSILIRGKTEILEEKKGPKIIVSEIPFGIKKTDLLRQIAKIIEERKIKGIRDFRDESDREGLRIVIDLKKDSQPERILNSLYKFTSLQTNFYLNMLALVDGIQPRVLGLCEILENFISHRKEVVLRRTRFDLERTKERVHVLEGLQIALSKIDQVIKTIKNSKDKLQAKENLIKKFKLTKIQAEAILEIKLSVLAKLEREKIENELKEKKILIKKFSLILKSPKEINEIIKKELKEIKEDFGDERKTKVFLRKAKEISPEDFILKELAVISFTQAGFIKRMKPSILKLQKRGGKGVLGQKTLEEDIVSNLILALTHDDLFFFTHSGKVLKTKVFEIPEAERTARGKNLLNFLDISPQEKVLDLIPLNKEEESRYFLMVTKNGIIKKTKISEFENIRKNGLIAIKLKKDDLLEKVAKSSGKDQIFLITKKGQAVRFKEEELKTLGRTTSGVIGIRLKKSDEVIGMEIVKTKELEKAKEKSLLVVSENGFGKRTDLNEYKIQKRGGMGIKTAKVNEKTGNLVASKLLKGSEKYLVLISKKGQVIKIKISGIPKLGRATQGVRIMRLEKDDKVASITCI